jgi:hypothetical protein
VITNVLPTGFSYLNTIGLEETLASRPNPIDPVVGVTLPVWGNWTIPPGGEVVLTFTSKIASSIMTGTYNSVAEASSREGNALPSRQPIDSQDVLVGIAKAESTYLPILLKGTEIAPTPTGTPGTPETGTPTPTQTPTSTPSKTPTTTVTPVIAPDLIVEQIVATKNIVQVVIKNQGNAPVNNSFWVDFYVDPNPPPQTVNEVWYDNERSSQGIVWGITSSALPINPNEILVLTYSTEPNTPNNYADSYYTVFYGNLQSGTPVYVHVDTVNLETNYGAILENHEITGGSYNNISNALSTSNVTSLMEVREVGNISVDSPADLPPRP